MSSDMADQIDAGQRWNRLGEEQQRAVLDRLYPELAVHGHLAAAMQAAAAELSVDLGTVTSAGVAGIMPDRDMQFSVAILKRSFGFTGWSRGVAMIYGGTSDLGELVRAAAAWRRGASLDEMQEISPSVEIDSLARAHERGPADAVAEQWQQLRARWEPRVIDDGDHLRAMTEMIDAARAAPVLRQLFPYTSLFTLCFSTCTGFPYSGGLAEIEPRQGDIFPDRRAGLGYVVRNPEGDVIGEADDANSAIAMLVAHLPAGIGPARAGTADDS